MQLFRSWINWHRWQFVAILWVLLCLMLVYLELGPRLRLLMASYGAWRSNEQTIAGMSDWEAKSNVLAEKISDLEQRVTTLYVSIPRNDQMSVILDCLQRSSEGIEMVQRQIKTEAPLDYAAHQEQPLRILAGGTFHGIAAFIDRIERSPYLIKVTALEIKRGDVPGEMLNAALGLQAIVVER